MPPRFSSTRSPHLLQWRARFWRRSLGAHDDDVAQRYLAYVLCPICIGILTYFAVRYLGVSHFPGYYKSSLLYHHRYALETAVNFGFWLYLVEEWGSRLLGSWATGRRRTVGMTCLCWSCGFGLACILQFTLLYERIDLYAPRIMHFFDLYPQRRPNPMLWSAIFGAIWSLTLGGRLALGLVLQQVAQRHRQLEMGKGPQNTAQKSAPNDTPPGAATSDLPSTAHKPIHITIGNLVSVVQPETLACVTSEGHYCRFTLKTEDKPKEIFTRAALRDVLVHLPSEDFIQIHRSHVINRHFIQRLKKSGRSYALYLDGDERPLPISRYRWPAIRDRFDMGRRMKAQKNRSDGTSS